MRTTLHFLQPLSWFLLLVSGAFSYISLSNNISGSSTGLLDSLSTGFSVLFIWGAQLCSSFSPQLRHLTSPKMRKFLMVFFPIVLVFITISSGIAIAGYQRKQARETEHRELDRDIAKVDLELKQLEKKNPSKAELKRMNEKVNELSVRSEQLSQKHAEEMRRGR